MQNIVRCFTERKSEGKTNWKQVVSWHLTDITSIYSLHLFACSQGISNQCHRSVTQRKKHGLANSGKVSQVGKFHPLSFRFVYPS